MDGWDITVNRVKDPAALPTARDADNGNVVITFRRAKGPLIFDLGICMVLIALPTLALLVAIPMVLGRRKFLPPFATVVRREPVRRSSRCATSFPALHRPVPGSTKPSCSGC